MDQRPVSWQLCPPASHQVRLSLCPAHVFAWLSVHGAHGRKQAPPQLSSSLLTVTSFHLFSAAFAELLSPTSPPPWPCPHMSHAYSTFVPAVVTCHGCVPRAAEQGHLAHSSWANIHLTGMLRSHFYHPCHSPRGYLVPGSECVRVWKGAGL